MTDKEKILAEIERLMHNHDSALDYEAALEDVRNFIDSLQEEPISEDFKKFEEDYLEENKDEILCVYDRHAGLVDGAKWQKEQMAKNALEADREEFPDGTFIYSTKNMIVDDMERRGITDLDNVKIILYGLS